MSQERIEAAAMTLCEQLWENAHERQKECALEEATEALAAADAVMFSDEAKARAVDRLHYVFEMDENVGEHDATAVWGTPEEIVAEVVSALRADV